MGEEGATKRQWGCFLYSEPLSQCRDGSLPITVPPKEPKPRSPPCGASSFVLGCILAQFTAHDV